MQENVRRYTIAGREKYAKDLTFPFFQASHVLLNNFNAQKYFTADSPIFSTCEDLKETLVPSRWKAKKMARMCFGYIGINTGTALLDKYFNFNLLGASAHISRF